ncbi:alpha-(1-_3)-fucosyltransferase [Aureococcus anophagefferens]|nr:alpha-(1->3)-fucosyltransferase [Aureococcus anophagefferens]
MASKLALALCLSGAAAYVAPDYALGNVDATVGNDATVAFLRHAEIKHGRVAMAAFLGFISAEQWANIPLLGKLQIFIAIGMLESYGEGAGDDSVHYMKGGVRLLPEIRGKNNGQLVLNLYDPFNFGMRDRSAEKTRLKSEILNGRAAMFGIFGFIAESKVQAPCPSPPRRTIRVVVYNKIKGYLDWLRPDFVTDARSKCSTECVFSEGRRGLDRAHGVLFHAKTHSAADFPAKKPKNAKYMLVSLEQEKYAPLLRNKNYVRRFDYVMTYDLDSTLPMISIHPHWDAPHYFEPAKGLPWGQRDDAAAARCLHNIDEPKLKKGENRGDAKRKLLARYKFALAFENAIVKDYVSEKVYDAILAGALPLYRGAERVDRLMPGGGAVLKFSDFGDDVAELAARLRVLARDRAAYDAHFAWRSPGRDTPAARAAFQKTLDMTAYECTALCRICAKLDADLA